MLYINAVIKKMKWYISMTLRWETISGQTGDFFSYLSEVAIPGTHQRMPLHTWHSTLYAIAELSGFSDPDDNMHDAALSLLQQFRANNIVSHLGELPKFEFSPTHLQHYADGSTIQFSASDTLTDLRRRIASAVALSTPNRLGSHASLFHPTGAKNSGSKLWGSIARNPDSSSRPVLQQKIDLPESFSSLSFTALEAILTISDQSLTNTLLADDFSIVRFA